MRKKQRWFFNIIPPDRMRLPVHKQNPVRWLAVLRRLPECFIDVQERSFAGLFDDFALGDFEVKPQFVFFAGTLRIDFTEVVIQAIADRADA